MVKRFSLGANSESVWERHPKCVKTGDRGKKGNETQSIYARGEIWIAIGIPLVLKKKHVNIPFDCCCLITQSRPTLWSHGLQHPRLPVLHYLPEFAQIHIHWIDDTIQPSHPLSPSSPLAFNLSQHQDLVQWVCSSHRWPQYWSFSLNISPSNEYSGLISFRIDWLDLLAVQGNLKSLLQHPSSKSSILWWYPYKTTGKPQPWLDDSLLAK